jgi:hypothetical protein
VGDELTNYPQEDLVVKKKNRIEMSEEIISRVKREMAKPRLAASVRNTLEAETASVIKDPTARAARA